MRLGILGGSFDPPHVGHLLAAVDACEALALDRLVLVPAKVQPLKVGQAGGTPAQRLAMTRLLVGDDPRFAVDPIEIERDGLSFSVDTLEAFARRFPEAERFFLVGADVLGSFARWREPERIVRLARLAIVHRADGGRGDEQASGAHSAPPSLPEGAVEVRTRRIDVSSTEIRARVRARQSIRGFVPEAVAAYIAAERLYR